MNAPDGIPHPRTTPVLYGHEAVEARLLGAYQRRRLHHAHLLKGPTGIGKATLAYRLARFVLAHPDPNADAVQNAQSLAIPRDHPEFARTAAGGHPDMLAIEAKMDGKQGISIAVLRKATTFLEQTAALGGWRVLLIDPGDDMAGPAANALLKSLEEPGRKTLILIVSHHPGSLLPTIRSRCSSSALHPLSDADMGKTLDALGAADDLPDAERARRLALAKGSVGRFLALSGKDLEIEERFRQLMSTLPRLPLDRAHDFADGLNRREPFLAFLPILQDWLAGSVRRTALDAATSSYAMLPGRLEAWATLWEKTARAAALADEYNLERKQVVLDALLTAAAIAKGPPAQPS